LVGGLGDGIAGLIWSVDFSPDGAYVVAGTNLTGRIEIVDVKTKRPAGHLAGHIQHIGAVKFSPDGKRLASGGHTFSDALKLWDFESRREIMSLSVDGAWSARQVEWLPDGNSIMLLTGDSIVSIWRVPSWEEIEKREGRHDLQK
jgi:WD40 repeat protein